MFDVAYFAWHLSRLLATKTEDEIKALQLCQTKVRAKKLPMEVIDAEYQWYVFFFALRQFSETDLFSAGIAEN